jgi:hypothetical protein
MLLSRFWYLALAVFGAAAFAGFFMALGAFNRNYERQLENQLERDRFILELVLARDARTRIQEIAGVAANPDVRASLRAATTRQNRDEMPGDLRERLALTLRQLNTQLRGYSGDLLIAVDAEGTIVAAVGIDAIPPGSGLGAFPLVERALAGNLRDDTWVFNQKVYRMAARPVVDGGQYVGAIVHGMELNSSFAQRLASDNLKGATLAFFMRNQVLGSYMPADEDIARPEDLTEPIEQAIGNEEFRKGNATEPIAVAGGKAAAIYSLITGSAAHSDVGYAIARPDKKLAGLPDLFAQMDFEKDLGYVNLAIVAGAAFLAFLFAMVFMFLEHDRPLSKMRSAAQELADGKRERFEIAKFGGKLRKTADAVNRAIDRAVEKAGAIAPNRKPANLDEILGPTPEGPRTPAFFAFADKPASGPSDIPPPPGGGPASVPPPAFAPPPPSPAVAPPPAGPGTGLLPPTIATPPPAIGTPPPAPKPPPAPPPPRGVPPHGPQAHPAPPPPRPGAGAGSAAKPAWAKGTLVGVGMGAQSDGSGPVQQGALASLPAFEAEEDDEGATMVANVPRELLDAASQLPPSMLGSAVNDERHYRDVFDQFVATKKQCGETVAGLTFDKFSQTLRKNRDQIVNQHGAAGVRFTVYVKDGKAALKATPTK